MTIKQAVSWLSQPGILAMIHDPTTKQAVRVAIKALSALGTNLAEVGTDLISRQAAIDALGEDPKYKARIFKTYKEGRSDQWFDDVAKILAIPSAQPEIVRCKDCKWFGNIGCAIEIVDDSDRPSEDDFCSFAERRTETE